MYVNLLGKESGSCEREEERGDKRREY